jgi:hypothetical protein
MHCSCENPESLALLVRQDRQGQSSHCVQPSDSLCGCASQGCESRILSRPLNGSLAGTSRVKTVGFTFKIHVYLVVVIHLIREVREGRKNIANFRYKGGEIVDLAPVAVVPWLSDVAVAGINVCE